MAIIGILYTHVLSHHFVLTWHIITYPNINNSINIPMIPWSLARRVRHPCSPNFNVAWQQCLAEPSQKNSHSCSGHGEAMVSNIETEGVWGLPVDVETFWSMAVFLEEPGIPMIVAKVTIKFSSKDTTCSWTVASLDAAALGVFGSCLTMVYVIHLPIYLLRKTYIHIYIYITNLHLYL